LDVGRSCGCAFAWECRRSVGQLIASPRCIPHEGQASCIGELMSYIYGILSTPD
jgi:hypothetical protein